MTLWFDTAKVQYYFDSTKGFGEKVYRLLAKG